jgi:DNA-binding NarL/FixJ family response regulator
MLPLTGRGRSFFAHDHESSEGRSAQVREERRCLIIDAQPTVRLGVRELLDDRYEVEEAADWRSGLEMVTAVGDFDVAIVELRRNTDREGDERSPNAAIRAFRKARSGLGIVAHGQRAERHAAKEAIDAGATAFVAKSSPADALARAVDAAAESERYIDPAAAQTASRNGPALTRRQRQILQLFADGQTTAQVAAHLGLSAETIRTHTKAILARLAARDRAHAVAKGFRSGFIV